MFNRNIIYTLIFTIHHDDDQMIFNIYFILLTIATGRGVFIVDIVRLKHGLRRVKYIYNATRFYGLKIQPIKYITYIYRYHRQDCRF